MVRRKRLTIQPAIRPTSRTPNDDGDEAQKVRDALERAKAADIRSGEPVKPHAEHEREEGGGEPDDLAGEAFARAR